MRVGKMFSWKNSNCSSLNILASSRICRTWAVYRASRKDIWIICTHWLTERNFNSQLQEVLLAVCSNIFIFESWITSYYFLTPCTSLRKGQRLRNSYFLARNEAGIKLLLRERFCANCLSCGYSLCAKDTSIGSLFYSILLRPDRIRRTAVSSNIFMLCYSQERIPKNIYYATIFFLKVSHFRNFPNFIKRY